MNLEQARLLRQAQESFRSTQRLTNQGSYDLAALRAHNVMFSVAEVILVQ